MNDLPEFEEIVKLYEPLIKKFLAKYHLLYDFDEYRQIAWIALWDSYRHYDPNKGPFPAFASIMVRGRLLTEIKRRKKYNDFHEPADKIQDYLASEEAGQSKTDIKFNLSCLSPRERLWLQAAIIEDQSTKTIAQQFHVTQDTVRSWKKSALKKLKQQVGEIKIPY